MLITLGICHFLTYRSHFILFLISDGNNNKIEKKSDDDDDDYRRNEWFLSRNECVFDLYKFIFNKSTFLVRLSFFGQFGFCLSSSSLPQVTGVRSEDVRSFVEFN